MFYFALQRDLMKTHIFNSLTSRIIFFCVSNFLNIQWDAICCRSSIIVIFNLFLQRCSLIEFSRADVVHKIFVLKILIQHDIYCSSMSVIESRTNFLCAFTGGRKIYNKAFISYSTVNDMLWKFVIHAWHVKNEIMLMDCLKLKWGQPQVNIYFASIISHVIWSVWLLQSSIKLHND